MEKLIDGAVMDGAQAFRLYETFGFKEKLLKKFLLIVKSPSTMLNGRWHAAAPLNRFDTMLKDVFTASALLDAEGRLGPTPFIGYDTLKADGVSLAL